MQGGNTPLMMAACVKMPAAPRHLLVEYLLSNGADPSLQSQVFLVGQWKLIPSPWVSQRC